MEPLDGMETNQSSTAVHACAPHAPGRPWASGGGVRWEGGKISPSSGEAGERRGKLERAPSPLERWRFARPPLLARPEALEAPAPGAWSVERDKRGREGEREMEKSRGVGVWAPALRLGESQCLGGVAAAASHPQLMTVDPGVLDPAVVMFPVYRIRRQCAVCCGYVSSLGPSGSLEGGELSSRPCPGAGRCTKARRGSAQSVAVSGYLSGGGPGYAVDILYLPERAAIGWGWGWGRQIS